MTADKIVYQYRGRVERGTRRGYTWREGFSEQGKDGPMYPWMTRLECQADAKARGKRASFKREDSDDHR